MDLDLTGKAAMVGGASRGLGYAVAHRLAADGADVSIIARTGPTLQDAARAIRKRTGANCLPFVGDLGSSDTARAWLDATLSEFGAVDLLFVNSGGPPPGEVLDFNDGAWRDAFDSVVFAALRLILAVAPTMRDRGSGSILFSTSSGVKEPITGLSLSNVTRASVGALAKTLSRELAASGVRVNHLVPGRFDTERVRDLDHRRAKAAGGSVAAQKRDSQAEIPIGRYGRSEEYAAAAAFLLSDAASYITGATLQIDGGKIRGVY